MKSLIEDESADSMIIIIIATTILFFGLAYILLSYSLNTPIELMNSLISDGMVTAETSRMYDLTLDMWRASPFFVMLGLVLWCYERGKGTELSTTRYFEYLFLMIFGIYISIYLIYCFGLSMDGITANLDASLLTDVSADWDVASERGTLATIMYYFCLLPAFITSLLFIIHPILKQRETKYIYDGEDEEEMQFGDIELGQV